jgi:hypothetical protein
MKKLLLTAAVAVLAAPAALAASSHYLKVSPTSVDAGKSVTVSGAVGNGCSTGHKGDVAIVFSGAFAGSTSKKFAGVPAFYVSLPKSGKFSFSVKIKASKVKPKTYSIGGRCGGGLFGSASLKVKPPSPGFY